MTIDKELMKLEVDQFKRELSSCRYYCRKLIEVNDKLEVVAVQLYSVSATDYSSETSGGSYSYLTPKLGLMIKEESLIKESSKWESNINYCRNVLSLCSVEVKDSLVRIFILKDTQENVAFDLNYARNGLMHSIDRELRDILFPTLSVC